MAKADDNPRSGVTGQPEEAAHKDGRKTLVKSQITEQASLLFARNGYPGTTLSDIAEAVGLTRSAVYYYFKNKEAVLEAIIDEVTSVPIRNVAEWRETAPEDSADRLKSFVRLRVQELLSRQIQMRMIAVTEAVLPRELAERHTRAKRKILDEYRSILRQGMEAGVFRAQDDRVAAFGIIGMVNWTASWFVPNYGLSSEQIAEQLAEMAVHSVAVPKDKSIAFGSASTALDAVRQDLDQLELLINVEREKT